MRHITTIAKKELRAAFLSPVALIFLLVFLAITFFWFFTVEQFWARNIADIRPLFDVFPVMLIFLVAALTMRVWSEEQKLGTLEVLLTMPVKVHQLVLGKFMAGLLIVGVALALTVHVPIIVSTQGELDWGPVTGGYLASLLLASAYLAIGLCASAITENQIVALILTVLVAGVFYLVGANAVAGLFPTGMAEVLRTLGTGARFESISRGVLDLRDLVYWASLTFGFLLLNTLVVSAKRWSHGGRTRGRRREALLFVALVGLNLATLNVWMRRVHSVRVDLTQREEFSVSDATKNLLHGLSSPLLIRGYFSSKTHPRLAPLVPKIRDLMDEYAAISRGRVTVEVVDPSTDEELEREALQSYGIRSSPFQFSSKYEAGVVNSYFSVLVKYGDQYQVLNFGDLIEFNPTATLPEVKLRNLEYDLTRAIKRTARGFQTLEALFASIGDEVDFTAYITPKTLPDELEKLPGDLQRVLEKIAARSNGRFKHRFVDPDGEEDLRQELFRKHGFRPMSVDPLTGQTFYLHLLLRVGDRTERVMPVASMGEAELEKELVAALKRSAPGFLKIVALVQPKSQDPAPPTPPGQLPPDTGTARMLEQKLRESYTVRTVDLNKGRIDGEVDVLVLLQPEEVGEKGEFAIDQYLMRGGSLVVLAGQYTLDERSGPSQGLKLKRVSSGLDPLLAAYGVTVQQALVLDPRHEKLPLPVVRDIGGFRVQQLELVGYPYFVDVRRDGMHETSPMVAGLPAVTMHWVSPISVSTPEWADGEEAGPREVTELLRSSAGAWTNSATDVQPDLERYPDVGFARGEDVRAHTLAVAISGRFRSAFVDRPSPMAGADAAGSGGDRGGRPIESSPDSSRLVVVGSSAFASDLALGIASQSVGDRATSNLQFAENVVDWAVADADLLGIRSRGTFARALLPSDPVARLGLEVLSYAIALVSLGLIVALTAVGRRRMKAIPSPSATARPDPA